MKKIEDGKLLSFVLWIILCAVGIYIIIKGISLDRKTLVEMGRQAQDTAIAVYLPAAVQAEEAYASTPASWLAEKIAKQLPVSGGGYREKTPKDTEDKDTSNKIKEENSDFLQARLYEENQEAGPAGAGEENTGGVDAQSQQAETVPEGQTDAAAASAVSQNPSESIPMEKFQDFDFVMNNFYTVDKTTSINGEQLNAPALLQKDLRMAAANDQPQILVYHSHSQEEFADSVAGDPSTTIVGVGARLVSILQNTYGYNVMHVTDEFDIVEGVLDRNKAYNYAQEKITQVLEENPSIEVVIDLHRDGVPDDKHLVTEVNGKPTAKIMLFNGLSRTTQNGDIAYLPNPYIEDNLSFSLQLAVKAKEYYPDWFRTIYLRGYRYNLHLRPKTLLVECGAQTNTVEEEMNAMEPLADVLNKVLKGE